MQLDTSTTSNRFFSRTKIIIGIVIILIIAIGGYAIARSRTSSYQFIAVKTGSINETVSVTGNTTPSSSVSLGFGNSGTISNVYFSVGDSVEKGQILAELNTNGLEAAIKQAQANADAEEATLAGLQAGTRPEQVAADQQKYNDAENTLLLAMNSAYAQVEDAILNKTDTLFTNGASANPTINVSVYTSDQGRTIDEERLALGGTLSDWKTAITSGNVETAQTATTKAFLAVNTFLSDLKVIVPNAANGSSEQAQINTMNAALTSASQEISAAASAEQTAQAALTSAGNTLTLDKAGSTPQQIQNQEAQVESAEAAVLSAEAKLEDSQIVAPIGGVITQFDAKVGETATPGTSLISIISENSFEVDALVSETDIGKIALNDKVSMTLDAFPGETFSGTVFYIDPAQTSSQGVVGYKIKVSFDMPDPRLKSGLTANLVVATRSKDNVFILPQYAILQNDNGTFVEILENGTVKDVPVTLGLQDQSGNVEITSGVTDGEDVINIGLKQ